MFEAFRDRYGLDLVQGWGMTETSPLAAVSIPPAGISGDEAIDYRVKSGRIVAGVELRITAEGRYRLARVTANRWGSLRYADPGLPAPTLASMIPRNSAMVGCARATWGTLVGEGFMW